MARLREAAVANFFKAAVEVGITREIREMRHHLNGIVSPFVTEKIVSSVKGPQSERDELLDSWNCFLSVSLFPSVGASSVYLFLRRKPITKQSQYT